MTETISGYVRACALADIPETGVIAVRVGDVPLAVVRSNGEVYALYDSCSHAEVALSEGDVDGDVIDCWLHGSEFDLRTGKPLCLPATDPVAVYPVKVDGDAVYVNVEAPLDITEQES